MQTPRKKTGRIVRPTRRGFRAVTLRVFALATVQLSSACYGTLNEGEDEWVDSHAQYGHGNGTGGNTSSSGSGGEAPIVQQPPAPPVEETVPYSTVATIVGRSCTAAKCHGRDEEPLIAADATLPHFLTTTVVEECDNLPLITPGEPANSALVRLVNWECGELVMPDTCRRVPCLDSADFEKLKAWIEQGAKFE